MRSAIIILSVCYFCFCLVTILCIHAPNQQKGVTGIDRAFEGEHGFMNTYFGGRFDRDAILRDLGREFLGSGTLYKRWSCVGTAHSHMKAAIDIVTRNELDLD